MGPENYAAGSTSCISIAWGILWNAVAQTSPGDAETGVAPSNLCFKKPSRWLWHMVKTESHCLMGLSIFLAYFQVPWHQVFNCSCLCWPHSLTLKFYGPICYSKEINTSSHFLRISGGSNASLYFRKGRRRPVLLTLMWFYQEQEEVRSASLWEVLNISWYAEFPDWGRSLKQKWGWGCVPKNIHEVQVMRGQLAAFSKHRGQVHE